MKEERIRELINSLSEASDAYYNGKSSGMTDREWDALFDELKALEAETGVILPESPTQRSGAKVDGLKKVVHEVPALSLDKVKYKNVEDLAKWAKADDSIVMSWKMDGLTLVLTYDDGRLTQAVTRGDGVEGSDVTHNAVFFKGIPQKIDYLNHLVVRGEAYMTFDEFERINAKTGGQYENPRNLASATIQMLDASESKQREICFSAFELVAPDTSATEHWDKTYDLRFMDQRLAWLKKLGFGVVSFETTDADNVLSEVEDWKERVSSLTYPTDGLVFSYNDLEKGWALGSTGHHPRWAIALKWTDETVTTTIREIEWSIGKTGIITPVAIFDPVRLGVGSTVTRASLHNLSVMKKLSDKTSGNVRSTKIIGAKAEVYLANMIIPQIASISIDENTECASTPYRCPVCGELTSVVWNMDNNVEVLKCTNADCDAQITGKLMNTFSKDGLFIKGLGESQIEDLLDLGLVQGAADFYTLRKRIKDDPEACHMQAHLLARDGWGQKKWDNLLDAIDTSRETSLQKFLYGLNIPLLGNDLSKKLAAYWKNDIDAFVKFIEGVALPEGASEATDKLCAIDGIGDEKAQNIVRWADEKTRKGGWGEVKALIAELHFPEPTESNTDNSLSGLTFVITGSVHDYKNRDEFKASVEARGGKVAGSVSAKTSYLVNNDVTSTSGKNKKAKELNIPIISEDEFIAKFGR